MKFRSLHNWQYQNHLEGVLYFAQRIDEMLFDFALDSYKPPALNSSFLCIEALGLINDIEKEVIDKANLRHVLEELQWSLSQDLTAKKLLQLETHQYLPDIECSNLDECRVRLELLLSAINPINYIKKNQELLRSAIENIEKNDIDTLCATYITSLINVGYHYQYIQKTAHEFFYYDQTNIITSCDDVSLFFEAFPLKRKKYKGVFSVSPLFSEIKDSCQKFKIELRESIEDLLDDPSEIAKAKDDLYLIVDNIIAKDPYAAREQAERRIEKLGNIFVLFHHKEQLSWSGSALIVEAEANKSTLLNIPISPMKKGFDLVPQKAAKELNRVITNLSLDERSFEKFDRVIDLHGVAVRNEVPENQLLNLWTSFETLIPAQPNKTKIRNVIDTLTPFLTTNYIRRLVERVTADLILWNKPVVIGLIRKLPHSQGLSLPEKIAALIVLAEAQPLRDELYTALGHFSLLRNRVFNLSQTLRRSKKVKQLIEKHEKKVRWQLRRIYRTRNLIVHAGTTPRYINTLIENAHDYLDTFLTQTVEFACGDEHIDSVEQVVKYVTLKMENRMKYLASEDIECDESNFMEILFG